MFILSHLPFIYRIHIETFVITSDFAPLFQCTITITKENIISNICYTNWAACPCKHICWNSDSFKNWKYCGRNVFYEIVRCNNCNLNMRKYRLKSNVILLIDMKNCFRGFRILWLNISVRSLFRAGKKS